MRDDRPDTCTAMKHDTTVPVCNFANERPCFRSVRGQSAITDRKICERHARRGTGTRLADKIEVGNLVGLKQRNDQGDAFCFPGGNLIVQPVPGARARGNRHLRSFGEIDPVEAGRQIMFCQVWVCTRANWRVVFGLFELGR